MLPPRQAFQLDLTHELAVTRRLLERLPDDRFGWQPHPKSMTLGDLGTHVANLLTWQLMILQTDGLDLARPIPRREAAADRNALLAEFDAKAEALHAALEAASDDDLAAKWTLRRGEQVLMARPRLAELRAMGLRHMVHHRGQLSVYLRLRDVPLPSIYGPTADTVEEEARAIAKERSQGS